MLPHGGLIHKVELEELVGGNNKGITFRNLSLLLILLLASFDSLVWTSSSSSWREELGFARETSLGLHSGQHFPNFPINWGIGIGIGIHAKSGGCICI